MGGVPPSFSVADLQVTRAALGQRQRRLGHPPQLQALLRARGGDRRAEVLARPLGVHPLGGAGAEDRLRGGLEAGLLLELLVGAGLECCIAASADLDSMLTWRGLGGMAVFSLWRRRKPVGAGSTSSGLARQPGLGIERVVAARGDVVGRVGWNSAASSWTWSRPTPSSYWPPP